MKHEKPYEEVLNLHIADLVMKMFMSCFTSCFFLPCVMYSLFNWCTRAPMKFDNKAHFDQKLKDTITFKGCQLKIAN